MRVLIREVPPIGSLEGIDLRHYHFRAGCIHEVGPRLAELLISRGYAVPARRQDDLDQAADQSQPPN